MPHKDPEARLKYARDRYMKLHPWHERTVEDRFWPNVAKTNACWLWTGAVSKQGYGQFTFRGKKTSAHRVSFWLATGVYHEGRGFHIHHVCHNPSCVNPNHLQEVSAKEHAIETHSGTATCKYGHPLEMGRVGYRVCPVCQKGYAATYRAKHPNPHAGQLGWRNKEKAQCNHGHPFDEGNTIWENGKRACRICKRRRSLEWYYRHKQLLLVEV